MPRKLNNRRRRVNKKTICMVYNDDLVLLAFIEYNKELNTRNSYFEGTRKEIRAEARRLGLDFTEWNRSMKDFRDKI